MLLPTSTSSSSFVFSSSTSFSSTFLFGPYFSCRPLSLKSRATPPSSIILLLQCHSGPEQMPPAIPSPPPLPPAPLPPITISLSSQFKTKSIGPLTFLACLLHLLLCFPNFPHPPPPLSLHQPLIPTPNHTGNTLFSGSMKFIVSPNKMIRHFTPSDDLCDVGKLGCS